MLKFLGFYAQGAEFVSNYELISTTVLGTDTASVTFSSLGTYSSDYKHLQIRFVARNTTATSSVSHRFKINGETSNYADHELTGNGTSVATNANTSQNFGRLGRLPSANQTANLYGAGVIDILDAYSTTKNKTIRTLGGSAGYNYIDLHSALLASTSAISSVELFMETGNYRANSRFSLYGIRG